MSLAGEAPRAKATDYGPMNVALKLCVLLAALAPTESDGSPAHRVPGAMSADGMALRDLLDCRWSPAWSAFLDAARQSLDSKASYDLALALLSEPIDMSDPRRSMCSWIFDEPRLCPLGYETALYLIAPEGYHGSDGLFSSFMSVLLLDPRADFSVDSSWPISPVEFVARGHAGRRLPPNHFPKQFDCDFEAVPELVGQSITSRRTFPDGPLEVDLHIFVLGLHKIATAEGLSSLYAAGSQCGVRITALDAAAGLGIHPEQLHRCSIYDAFGMACPDEIDQITNAMYHHVWVKQAPGFETLSELTSSINALDRTLQHSVQRNIDIVLISTNALLFSTMVLNMPSLSRKPTIVYTSTDLHDMMLRLHVQISFMESSFRETMSNPNRVIAVWGLYSQLQWHGYLGVAPVHVPALSLYMGANLESRASRGLLVVGRNRAYDAYMCFLRKLVEDAGMSQAYDVTEFRGLPWTEMAKFSAAAYFPYTQFTMKFNELYRMSVPMFLPRHISQYSFTAHIKYELREFGQSGGRSAKRYWSKRWNDGYNTSDFATYTLLRDTEFCRWPHLTFFSSLAHLVDMVGPQRQEDLRRVRASLRQHNAAVREASVSFWVQSIVRFAKSRHALSSV